MYVLEVYIYNVHTFDFLARASLAPLIKVSDILYKYIYTMYIELSLTLFEKRLAQYAGVSYPECTVWRRKSALDSHVPAFYCPPVLTLLFFLCLEPSKDKDRRTGIMFCTSLGLGRGDSRTRLSP